MFGYIRPYKPNLLMREWQTYRAVYCGLCKAIGRRYGQSKRMALTYDVTFLALFLQSLRAETPKVAMETCIANPLRKKPVQVANDILDFCADVTVLLAYYKACDDQQDEAKWKGRAAASFLRRAYRKASAECPALAQAVRQSLSELERLEQELAEPAGQSGRPLEKGVSGVPNVTAEAPDHDPDILLADSVWAPAKRFGDLLGLVLNTAVPLTDLRETYWADALAWIGKQLGIWIYLLDAIDDWAQDRDNNEWNPYRAFQADEAHELADRQLIACEEELDRTAALLPYIDHAGIVRNVICEGLPEVRRHVLAGERLTKL